MSKLLIESKENRFRVCANLSNNLVFVNEFLDFWCDGNAMKGTHRDDCCARRIIGTGMLYTDYVWGHPVHIQIEDEPEGWKIESSYLAIASNVTLKKFMDGYSRLFG